MTRPTFLIAEPAPGEGLSSRKLVIETAYFNVLTAYSGPELLLTIKRFPLVDAVIFHTGLPQLDIPEVVKKVRETTPGALIIALAQTQSFLADNIDEVISSHEPQQLLAYIERRFGRLSKRDLGIQQAS